MTLQEEHNPKSLSAVPPKIAAVRALLNLHRVGRPQQGGHAWQNGASAGLQMLALPELACPGRCAVEQLPCRFELWVATAELKGGFLPRLAQTISCCTALDLTKRLGKAKHRSVRPVHRARWSNDLARPF